MIPIILVILILVVSFIGSNFISAKLQSKFYSNSGIEYIFLGILLGPAFSGWVSSSFNINYPLLITGDVLSQLNPFISAAIGFIGFITGLNCKIKTILKFEPEHVRLSIYEVFLSGFIIGGAAFGILYYFYYDEKNLVEILIASYTLGLAGSLSSNYMIKKVKEKYNISGKISLALMNASLINQSLVIFLFGLIFVYVNKGQDNYLNATPVEWILISLFIPFLIGILLFIFLGRETDEKKLFIPVIGIVIFTCGVAYYLNYSPLFLNFILGLTIANISKIGDELNKMTEKFRRSLSIIIVISAGYLLYPVNSVLFYILAFCYISIRYFSKRLSGYIAYSSSFEREKLSPQIGRGLMPIGIVSCAIVIDYNNYFKNEFTMIVLSCIIISVLLFEILGFICIKKLLIDSGEISGEIK